MNETSTTSTAPSALPTLGDKPSNGNHVHPASPRKRRFGRKFILASVAALLVAGSATSAMALTQSKFSDVGPDHPFADDIGWVSDQHVANGYADGTFKPSAPVSRQAMAAFIHNYADGTEKVTQSFTFSGVGSYSNYATCPAGKRPIAGGGQTAVSGFAITDSYINGSSWHIRWETKNTDLKAGNGTVFVICQPSA